jgi:hypothetical protein
MEALRTGKFQHLRQLALIHAKLLQQVIAVSRDRNSRQKLLHKIDEIRKDGFIHDEEIAITHTLAILQHDEYENNVSSMMANIDLVEKIHTDGFTKSLLISSSLVEMISVLSSLIKNSDKNMELAEKINTIRSNGSFENDEKISEFYASALSYAAVQKDLNNIIERLEALQKAFKNNSEIARSLTKALVVSMKEASPEICLTISDKIDILRRKGFKNNKHITMLYADSIVSAAQNQPLNIQRKLLEKLEKLRRGDLMKNEALALLIAQLMSTVSLNETDPKEKLKIAERLEMLVKSGYEDFDEIMAFYDRIFEDAMNSTT